VITKSVYMQFAHPSILECNYISGLPERNNPPRTLSNHNECIIRITIDSQNTTTICCSYLFVRV